MLCMSAVRRPAFPDRTLTSRKNRVVRNAGRRNSEPRSPCRGIAMASIALPSTAPQDPARELPYNARIANAIGYVAEHYQDQPSLEEMAGAANLSPFHFQRIFKRWAGISPKRFLQYVTLAHAKRLLAGDASVLDAALDTGLSGPSRLHDLFVSCEAMTPGEFKALGEQLVIRWGLHDGPLGRVLLGATERGVCWLSFVPEGDAAAIGQPGANRAVGRAIGANNISWLIPCHRVILNTGIMHNYRWGVAQKRVLTAFEAALERAR